MTAEIYFFGKLVSASEFAKIAESTKNAGIDPIIDKNCMPSLF